MKNSRTNRKQDQTKRLFLAMGGSLTAVLLLIIGITFYGAMKAAVNSASIAGWRTAIAMGDKEEAMLLRYENLLNSAVYITEEKLADEENYTSIQEWMSQYAEYAKETMDLGVSEIYGIIRGELLSGSNWDYQSAGYDPHSAQWHQKALEAGGDIAFIDVYTDAKTGLPIISMSRQFEADSVLAIDIPLETFQQTMNSWILMDNSVEILFDTKGDIIAHQHAAGEEIEFCEINRNYTNPIFAELLDNKQEQGGLRIRDINGKEQVVYFYQTRAGWYSAVVLPASSLVAGTVELLQAELLLVGILFAVILFLLFVSYFRNKKAYENREILHALGDTYYGIFAVNLDNQTFRTVKSLPDIEQKLRLDNHYENLFQIQLSLLEERDRSEFTKIFSMDAISELWEQGVRKTEAEYMRRFGDEYKWVNAQLLLRHHGSREAVVAFKLIHEEKTQELEQKKLLRESLLVAQKQADAKSDFLSRMSHDMRTPMNAIIGLSELARRHIGNDEQVMQDLEKIDLSSRHLLRLINDILDMSKIEQGKLELHDETFQLTAHLKEVISIFEGQAARDRKELCTAIQIQNDSVCADSLRLDQIINNILSNAVKFTQPGGKIEIIAEELPSTYEGYGSYRFTFRDNGIGMSAEFLKKIFLPFEQEQSFLQKKVSGTGLGMPIVKNIVQMMNGQIDVSSEPGKGSVFVVTLPLRLAEPAKTVPVPQQPDSSVSFIGKRILLAEDNEINMEIASELLQMEGAEVVPAWNGKEAVERFSASEPGYYSAILMDIQMPEMDGYTAARTIRALPRPDAADIPILAMTANAFADDVAHSREAGMNEHIAKPIDIQKLCAVLKRYLA